MNDLAEDDIFSIKSILFHVEKDEKIKEVSAHENGIETSVPRTMDSEKVGGLVDHRLGSSNGEICRLCKQQVDCPTHTSYIDLSIYVINSYYYDEIHKILNCICLTCGKIIKDQSFDSKKDDQLENIKKLPKHKRLDKIIELTKKVKSCSKIMYGCSSDTYERPEIAKLKKGVFPLSNYELYFGKRKDENGIAKEPNMLLGGKNLYNILIRISDATWELMGFDSKLCRPEHLLIHNLPIPARATRLTHVNENGYSDDDLIMFQRDIMKNVEDLKALNAKGNESGKIDRNITAINFYISTMMNNTHPMKSRHKNSYTPLKSIHERLDKKTGLFRKNLNAKRIGLSARSVVSGDPHISIDEVHMPQEHAQKLDFPVVVTEHNIKMLQQLVNAGPKVYPGANRVRIPGNKNSSMISLKYAKNHIELKKGYIVFRHLQDGDYVLINRQPSLHKDSIQAHRVKVRKYGRTIGLSVIATEPYNADFDGDEMNIFAMHNIQSMIEIEHLASIKNNIMSTGKSKTNFGLNNDSMVGAYCLSQPNISIHKNIAVKLLSKTNLSLSVMKSLNKESYSGHELISIILPKHLNYVMGPLKIVNGKLIAGFFTKKSIGTGRSSIINTIYYLCGNKITMDFINNIQKMSVEYLAYFGFSVGFRDIFVPDEIKKEKLKYMENYCSEVNSLLREEEIKSVEVSTNMDFEKTDDLIFQKIRKMRDVSGKIVQKYFEKEFDNDINNEKNNVMLMQLSGSKGKPDQLAQMTACVGQQEIFLRNKSCRIERSCNQRLFARFTKNDLRVEAGGAVISSFLEGMNPNEIYSHAYSGRIGMIDKGIGTADTGYIQRKLIKSLEGTMLYSDYTVRNANNEIVQLISGSNCINPADIVETSHEILMMNNVQVLETYLPDKKLQKKLKLSDELMNSEKHKYIQIRNNLRNWSQRYWSNTTTFTNKFFMPFNLEQLIEVKLNNKTNTSHEKKKNSLTYEQILTELKNLKTDPLMSLACISINDTYASREIKNELALYSQNVMYWFIDTYLSPKKVLMEYKFNNEEFTDILNDIKRRYIKVRQSPGDLIGIIAAQTIGEPTTQMNLNAFHHAGTSGENVSNLGLKRVKELMNLTDGSKLKAPQMKLFFKKSIRESYDEVKKIANHIKSLFLIDVVSDIRLYFDPIGQFLSSDVDSTEAIDKPWVFQYQIPQSVIEDKNLVISQIENGIEMFCLYRSNKKYLSGNKSFKKQFVGKPSIFTTKKDHNVYVHIRFKLVDVINNTLYEMSKLITENSKIVGVDNIYEASIVTTKYVETTENGSIEESTEHYIITDGINLSKIIHLNHLDHSRLHCNDFYQIHQMFGIEAVRKMLFDEYRAIICSNSEINHSHISLLVDFTCHKAGMIAITASKNKGVNSLKIDPLTKASFEETTNMIMNSALYNEEDQMRYVSSTVIAGQTSKIGSGYCDLGLNLKLIEAYTGINEINADQEIKFLKSKIDTNIKKKISNSNDINLKLEL